MASLLTLVSCESTTSAKSHKCSFNGEPVECSKEMSSETDQLGEAFTLTSSVTAEISISSVEIEFLENTNDIKNETRNGNEYECSSGTIAGQIIAYKVNENKMKIFYKNDVETYTRVSGEEVGIDGSWKNVERDEMGITTTILTITKNKMNLTVKCGFNN